MSVLIVGAEGSMGKRYQAILNYLHVHYYVQEELYADITDAQIPDLISGIIIATPTDTHAKLIRNYLRFKKPILCEKPVVKNLTELRDLKFEIKAAQTPFSMMLQYEKLDDPDSRGVSWYNYYKHGNDGLVWDCLQVIGLARGSVNLHEESPIWDCTLNGKTLSSGDMDRAYVESVKDWLAEPNQDFEKIWDLHVKTSEMKKSGRYG